MSDVLAVVNSPTHVALRREAGIAGGMLGSGVTLLSKANLWQPGIYNEAFFNLSIGLERLAKLIIITEHAASYGCTFPDNEALRKAYGHDLRKLLEATGKLAPQYLKGHQYEAMPQTDIHIAVVDVLCDFAKSTRYYNLDFLTGGKSKAMADPVADWYRRVGQPILKEHYTTRAKARDEQNAALVHALLGDMAAIIVNREDGRPIDDPYQAAMSQAQSELISKYGRLYVVQIIRHLAYLLWEVEHKAHTKGYESIPALHEFFVAFTVPDDGFIKRRKTWSIYRL